MQLRKHNFRKWLENQGSHKIVGRSYWDESMTATEQHSPAMKREEWAYSIIRSIHEYVISVEGPNEIPPEMLGAVCELMQLMAEKK